MSFSESVKKNRLWLVGIGIVVLAIAIAVWASGSDDTDTTATLEGGSEGEAGNVTSDTNALVLDENGRVIAVSNSSGGTSDSEGGSDSSGSDSGGQTTVDGSPPPPAEPGAVMTVKILFWNDTEDNAPDGCEITLDGQPWSPDTSGASAEGEIGDLAYDAPLDLVILPEGPGGDSFTIPVSFHSVMEPGSEQDAIHVEISDRQVRVIGNAVENFDARFDRS